MTGESRRKELLGYADRLTVRPGERIEFKISAERSTFYSAQLVRLVNGDSHSSPTSFKEVELDCSMNGTYRGRPQCIVTGSCVVVDRGPLEDATDQITVALSVMPTTPLRGVQHLIGRWNDTLRKGWSLHLNDEGRLVLTVDARGTSLSVPLDNILKPGSWYHVATIIDWRTSSATVFCMPHGSDGLMFRNSARAIPLADREVKNETEAVLLMAAAFGGRDAVGRVIPAGCFNGRIEAPVIYRGVMKEGDLRAVLEGERPAHLASELIGDWDFSRRLEEATVFDRSPSHAHGYTHNLPLRGVRGARWKGKTMEWPNAPEQYGAIHFHCDDLYDCGWLTDIEFMVPSSMRSGIYALRLRTETSEEYIPFFVAAPKRSPQSRIALLVPTHTYVAYGNFHALETNRKKKGKHVSEFYAGHMIGPGSLDYAMTVEEHYDLGLSTYDRHADGSPVEISSWLRPLLNVRPKAILWTLCADLLLTDWLEAKSFPYDVITDDLIQQEGLELLKEYEVIITGNHPEYCTTGQLEAITSYITNGGRLMYLGGNGFYWRIGVHPRFPAAIEVRRGQTGTTVNRSAVGEACLASTGEVGGLWRDLGRPPQQTVGVGFIAQGEGASYYRILPEARRSLAAFILSGVDGDTLGDFGIFGGAAGQEIDKSDHDYGTPENAIVVARSEKHEQMSYVIEEMMESNQLPESYRHLAYSEIVFFENRKGGAVFSVGSMAWCGSLGTNDYNNDVSRITANVLNKFLREAVTAPMESRESTDSH